MSSAIHGKLQFNPAIIGESEIWMFTVPITVDSPNTMRRQFLTGSSIMFLWVSLGCHRGHLNSSFTFLVSLHREISHVWDNTSFSNHQRRNISDQQHYPWNRSVVCQSWRESSVNLSHFRNKPNQQDPLLVGLDRDQWSIRMNVSPAVSRIPDFKYVSLVLCPFPNRGRSKSIGK
jgi:hypothetical protein